MRTIYLCKDEKDFTRRVVADMPYLVTHKKIRLLKYLFENGLYIPYKGNSNGGSELKKYLLSKEIILKEDKDFYYFNFPLKKEDAERAVI